MLNLIRKSAKILKNNLVFIQPLLLCLLIFMMVTTFFINKNVFIAGRVCLLLSMLLLTIAFTAGWLHINKYGVHSYNEDDTQEEIAHKAVSGLKTFFEGIGENFFKTLGAYFVIFLSSVAVIYFVSKLLTLSIGEPKLIYEIPKLAKATSQAEILNFMKNISVNDKLVFVAWMFVSNIVLLIINFFVLLYFSVLNFEKDNFIKAIWTAIKFFFKNLFSSLGIILFIFILYLGLNFLSLLLGTNSFSLVILIILFTAYLNYCVLLVFCFYYEKAKNNSNCGSECIGKNEISD
ncbi:MAG: hypothetical protein IJY61_07780 [Candidatus Gastranaerophilales bacterium]|nr:hypothetical protein [Candidatus Gastranaerophilales bacterium]